MLLVVVPLSINGCIGSIQKTDLNFVNPLCLRNMFYFFCDVSMNVTGLGANYKLQGVLVNVLLGIHWHSYFSEHWQN